MQFDPVKLEVFKSLFHSIAEEMGATLRRTAYSPNIKERRDYSTAVFDGQGRKQLNHQLPKFSTFGAGFCFSSSGINQVYLNVS